MTTHDLAHKLAFVKHQTEQALKTIAPFYTTDAGCMAKTYLNEALAGLDGIDHHLGQKLAKEKK